MFFDVIIQRTDSVHAFLVYKKFEEWTGGVWHWIFFLVYFNMLSHLIFTSSYSMLVEFPMQHRLVPRVLLDKN